MDNISDRDTERSSSTAGIVSGMPSKGRYTAGKQVSRWEADSENIDIEYKNLEGQSNGPAGSCSNCTCPLGEKKPVVIKVLLFIIVFGAGLVLGFIVRKTVDKGGKSIPDVPVDMEGLFRIQQDYNQEFSQLMQDDLEDVINYEDHMNIITECVHMSGMGSANKLLDYVEAKWRTFPFDTIKIKRYNVTLSYPNYTNIDANVVTMHAANGTLVFRSQYNRSSEHPEYLPFSAYSPSGIVKTKRVIYGHYARMNDLKRIEELHVSIKDAILLVRYGKITPASKVKNAEQRGAAGVILYSDPADYAGNQSSVYPENWWLPGWAVQLSHVRYQLSGDPKTPDYSSITGVHHKTETKSHFPNIPVQPIRYIDAKVLLSNMNGPIVDNDWYGGLGIKYRLGPGYIDDREVTLYVDNMIQERIIENIIGVMKGHAEPDKYIIIGAHIDSWIQGAVDSGSGYTVLQELARCFAYHVNKGWKPRRTIMFALWDGTKYGSIGSYEWVQEYEHQLQNGAVAYINLDSLIRGNFSFTSAADPLLRSVLIAATKTVRLNCTGIPGCQKDATVYDQWLQNLHQTGDKDSLRFESMGDDSDHGAFLYRTGIPVVFPRFTYDKNRYPAMTSYPAYGALEDTKEYIETFIDPDYTLHITMAKVVSDLILRLSDSAILPFDLNGLIDALKDGNQTVNVVARQLQSYGYDISDATKVLSRVTHRFVDVANDLMEDINSIKTRKFSNFSEFDLYHLNHKLVQLSRAFISDNGLPHAQHYRNILYAPDIADIQNDLIFPGIVLPEDRNEINEVLVDNLKQQISLIVLAINRANEILSDGLLT
ncbi:N-acetylated-alpha-linked acidic dipeptidase 2-like isoform X1 [Mya arenaria]|uniref:N-acetylated-alpha-linked acidic dipeptidase 2-like isoform X1 n=1 Tax=Mya arenaria TaxID=6604 RepID=UPI0022E204DE|nr:N-acetylated-alpha-linked acidic dipeptidase 2-like isoform X1 [Mya arenaria]